MTARVINDPSALGWEYDPDTGRWTWGGHSSSGGGGGGSFPEAPVDGRQYGRQNAGWTEIVSSGGGAGPDPRISDTQIGNWDTSFSWGDHGEAGYLTSFTEADPTVPDHVKAITTTDIANWNAGTGGGGGGGNDPRITNTQISNWDTAYGWGNHASQGYLTSASLNSYATQAWVGQNYQIKGSYAASNHNHNGVYQPAGNYLTGETDPTVPPHVKSISTADISKWNNPPAAVSNDTWDDTLKRNASTTQSPSAPNYYALSNTYTLGGVAGGGSRIISYDGTFVFHNSGNAETGKVNGNGNINGTSFTSTVNNTALLTMYGNAIANEGNLGAGLYFTNSASTPTITPCRGTDFAQVNNTISLGNPNYRFTKVWAVGGVGSRKRHTQNDGEAVLSVRDLISVFESLREATKEERTVEGLRDSIGNCVGGIVERLEAIQAATDEQTAQEMAMYAENEEEPMPPFPTEPLSPVEQEA